MSLCPNGRYLVFQLLNHVYNHFAPLRSFSYYRLYLLSNLDAPLDVCRIVPHFHFNCLYDVCSLFGYIFCFGLHNVKCVLDGSEIRCSKCLAYHSQCSRDHGPYMARRHGLALRAVDAVQRVAKVLSKFGSMLAEFE
jgi:hypothetical protein